MKKITLVLLSTILAGCCKMPNFVGKTFILPKNWQSELTFLSDSTVSYKREYGWGVPKQEGFAKWEIIDNKHIRLTSDYTHQNIPIDVTESKSLVDSLQFILMDKVYPDITIWLCIGDEKYKFNGQQLAVPLQNIYDFQSFNLVANANTDKYAPLLNNDQIRTAIYTVRDTGNNLFKITLPLSDSPWIDVFYYQELNYVLKIKKCKGFPKWKNPPLWNRHLEWD